MGNDRRHGSCLGRLLKVAAWTAGVVLAVLAAWMVVNTPPPSAPVERDRLSDRDLDLARESQHLRAAVGDRLWPGFQDAALPLQLYNDRFGFVMGIDAPAGWEAVGENGIDGRPYYRTSHPQRQSFVVRIADRWVASIGVKDAADAEMPRVLHEKAGLLTRLVPYRLFIPATDQYVGLVLHEQFHAFAATRNAARFGRAVGVSGAEARYPWADGAFRNAWVSEVGLLQSALTAGDAATRAGAVARFLASRKSRRARLDAATLAFERELEWLEGLAKYVELTSWRLAAEPGYTPLPATRDDRQFHGYSGYEARWTSERMSMSWRVNLHGDLPFYGSGALQAMVLDLLEPSWKDGYLESELSLDERLGRALESSGPPK
jgi:hypothetical protein